MPKVSVIMPAYNQEKLIGAAINSIFKQTFQDIEIIVVDDGSTDRTCEVVKRYPVTYIYQPHKGPSAARNKGISEAKGDYICFLDSDDLYHPEKIEKQVRFFVENPDMEVSYCAVQYIDEKDNDLGIGRGIEVSPQNLAAHMLFRTPIPAPSTIMVKKHCFKKIGGYDEGLIHGEDYDITLRLAINFNVGYLDLALYKYRRHKKNISNNVTEHNVKELLVMERYSEAFLHSLIEKTSYKKKEKELLWAKILYKFGKTKSCKVKLLELIQCYPTMADAHFYLGNIYLKDGQFIKAEECYRYCTKFDQSNSAAWNNLAVCLMQNQQDTDAIKCLQKALELQPTYLDAKQNLQQLRSDKVISNIYITERELRQYPVPYVSE